MHHSRFILRAVLGALILVVLLPSVALGISRDAVLARGKVWVDKNVAYSQSRYATVAGKLIPTTSTVSPSKLGYRTDCSGFVSMCLGLTDSKKAPLSLTTRSLSPSVVTTITKGELLPGDVMLLKGSHVVLFTGWADSARRTFRAYEERGTAYGTVQTVRTYADMDKWGYHPYRYKRIDDFYVDCQQALYGTSRYSTAVIASRVSHPTTSTATVKTVVVTNGEPWTGNLTGAALAGAYKSPLVLTATSSLPASATETIKRFKPQKVLIVGGPANVSSAVYAAIKKLGPSVARVSGDRFVTAAQGAKLAVSTARAAGRTVDAAYLVGPESWYEGVAVSPAASKTGRPILLTARTSVPASTLEALKATGIKKVYIIGGTGSVSSAVALALQRRGISVSRVAGVDYCETAQKVAHHVVAIPGGGLTWTNVAISTGDAGTAALACGVAQGQAGSVLLFTPGTKLYSGAATEITRRRAGIGKVRVFGSYYAIGLPVRTSIANIMRAK